GSDLSQKSLEEAKIQADGKRDTKLHLVSVVTQIGPASHQGVAQSIQKEVAEKMRNEIDEIEKELTNAGYQVQTDVMIDNKDRNSGHHTSEYAEDKQVNVTMTGNRAVGDVKWFFLGCVRSQVTQHATCHVYIIK